MLITEAEKCLELPPRTRRIRCGEEDSNRTHGTTSAYAENTLQTPHTPIFGGTTSAYAENTRGRRGVS